MAQLMPLVSVAGHEGAHGPLAPDKGYVFGLINFVVLAAGLVFLLRKPLRDFFAKRAELLKAAVEQSKKNHEIVLKGYQEVKKKLDHVDAESRLLIQNFKENGEAEKIKIIEQAREYSEKLKEDAKKIADSELKRAKEELKLATVGMARDLAEKSLKEAVKSEDETRLVQEFLKQVGQR